MNMWKPRKEPIQILEPPFKITCSNFKDCLIYTENWHNVVPAYDWKIAKIGRRLWAVSRQSSFGQPTYYMKRLIIIADCCNAES